MVCSRFLGLLASGLLLAGCAESPQLRIVGVTGTNFRDAAEGQAFGWDYTYGEASDIHAEVMSLTDADGEVIVRWDRDVGALGLAEMTFITELGEFARAFSSEWDADLRLATTQRDFESDPRIDTSVLPHRERTWSYDEDGGLRASGIVDLAADGNPDRSRTWRPMPRGGLPRGDYDPPLWLAQRHQRFDDQGNPFEIISTEWDAGLPTQEVFQASEAADPSTVRTFRHELDSSDRLVMLKDCADEVCETPNSFRVAFTYTEGGLLHEVHRWEVPSGASEEVAQPTLTFYWVEDPVGGVRGSQRWLTDPQTGDHTDTWCVTEWDGLVLERRCYAADGWLRESSETEYARVAPAR